MASQNDSIEERARREFATVANPELTVEQFVAIRQEENRQQQALAANPAATYIPALGTMTQCGNGDFATMLDPNEWQGAYGTLYAAGGTPGNINFSALTAGIASGPPNLGTSHQTWVGPGTDAKVGISTVPPGAAGAVRIGNSMWGGGCELLSKTFIVQSSQPTIRLWYSAVLLGAVAADNHPPNQQAYFRVRVTDALGNLVVGAFDFGAGSGDTLIADPANPFFLTVPDPSPPNPALPANVLYRDWSCVEINLATQVGNVVTIEFITADCWPGGHYGYAYIGQFCGSCKGSPTGSFGFDASASSICGDGRLCFDYELPATQGPAGPITGSVTITLDVYQNGGPKTQFVSSVLTSGTSYCFPIVPTAIPGIDLTAGGFDIAATATFGIGSVTLGQLTAGVAPYGMVPGQNNDYQIVCTKSCDEINQEQDEDLSRKCAKKVNYLARTPCHGDAGPGVSGTTGGQEAADCRCDCVAVELPDLKPCIAVKWGDSDCDCIETDDFEILCVTVCNCYSNVTFEKLTIGHITLTDMAGNPVASLPDGTPSVQVVPSGPICFGDIGPCKGKNAPTCVSREFVLYTRGAIGKDYKLSFEGVCFGVTHHLQVEECFVVKLCQD